MFDNQKSVDILINSAQAKCLDATATSIFLALNRSSELFVGLVALQCGMLTPLTSFGLAVRIPPAD